MAKKSYKIGIDLGTANILVYINGNGVVYNEPSVVAFDKETNKCIAVGKQASEMLGKEHSQIRVVKPLEGGAIADVEATEAYLEYVFNKLDILNVDLKSATLLLCCPSEVSHIERNALINLAKRLGVEDVFIEEEIKAGAIGAGVDIYSSRGSMIVDIGGGTTDIGVLSLGDLVLSESVKIAGIHVDKEIIKYVKFKYGMLIGDNTAEQIKIALGTLRTELPKEKEFTFAGRSIKNGLPCRMKITQSEIRTILLNAFQTIVNRIVKVLQQTPPELSADIYEDGIVINGGGALIDGLKEYLEAALSLKIKIAPNPLTSIVEGSRILLANRGNYLAKPSDF